MRRFLIYAVFVLGVLAIGMTIGAVTRPGAWYAALVKPPFNPPDWVFAPVWTALYAAIAVAGLSLMGLPPSGGFNAKAMMLVAAVDLGATSGRVMIGRVGDGILELESVARFPNGPVPATRSPR